MDSNFRFRARRNQEISVSRWSSTLARQDLSTSMGRLTLNVLLSFAQFEREVIGERIRDKLLGTWSSQAGHDLLRTKFAADSPLEERGGPPPRRRAAPASTSVARSASGRSRRPRSGGMFSGFAIRRSPPRSGFSPATFKAGGDRVIVPSIFETRRSRGLLEMKY
jgi:hypothetical protein